MLESIEHQGLDSSKLTISGKVYWTPTIVLRDSNINESSCNKRVKFVLSKSEIVLAVDILQDAPLT